MVGEIVRSNRKLNDHEEYMQVKIRRVCIKEKRELLNKNWMEKKLKTVREQKRNNFFLYNVAKLQV